jgi:exopolysaccharide biosynthesis polyprenyl glycosylphosphotransferase
VGIQVFERPEPLMLIESATRIRVDRRVAGYLATVGRFGVVWLPAYAFASNRVGSTGGATLLASVLAGLWFLTLSHSFDAARLTRLSLGPAVAAALGTATGAIAVCALKFWIHFPLTPVQLIELTALAFVGSWLWEVQVHRSVAARRRVLVIGGEDATKLVEAIRSEEEAPFDVVSLLDDDQAAEIAGYLVEERKPDIVVLATDDPRPRTFEQLLDAASSCAFKVVGLPEFHEHAFGRVPVEAVRPTWFMNVLHLYQRPYSRLAKRTFDVVVALAGLVVVSWLLPILYLVVRRTGGPGPVIFKQTRLGEGGRHFTIYKFRTMRNDAEAAGAVWASQNDPRITKAGRLMRKTRLDELPQLWNVLKGDMSIVGPRPERPEFLEQLQDAVPFWTRRHLVKPGITGWAQVRRGYTADAEGTAEKLSYDLWYLRHRSLLIDLAVCVKTFTTIFTGSGAR